MTEHIDCVVIGAGVVGLAVARAVAKSGREVIVVEAETAIGTVTSARNSEVIHAGIYDPGASLKGRLCVRGKNLLYSYLDHHGIDHARCGKLVVATTNTEHQALKTVLEKAAANGCNDLQWLDQDAAQGLEPELSCHSALLSPSTGILDSHGYMLSLQGEIETHGGWLALSSPVLGGDIRNDAIVLRIGGLEAMELDCATVINSAGLNAQTVAANLTGMPAQHIPRQYLCKGSYFTLSGKTPFSRLIYPVPGAASLGCHFTRDLAGQGRFGPDAEWITAIDLAVDANRAQYFYADIRRYWPGLPDGALTPAYAGIRPKLQAPGAEAADFRIDGPDVHGVRGLINLFGLESPGLTASLAIADHVVGLLDG